MSVFVFRAQLSERPGCSSDGTPGAEEGGGGGGGGREEYHRGVDKLRAAVDLQSFVAAFPMKHCISI